eukprot:gene12280-25826_t
MKVRHISEVLTRFYPNPPVPLNSHDTFTFLVAVVLSAQTTDGKVNDVTKELFRFGSTPEKMAKLDPTFVQSIIQPVGLAPKKALYIVNLSRNLVERYNGVVPSTYEDLESLPGVGHKTASVVMSQSFGEPSFAVDTHVHRLALRWGLSKDQKNVNNVQKDLCALFPREEWNMLHLQMIYFGREFCSAKTHEAVNCPICSWVNKPDGTPPADFTVFTPQKPSKGIVYYRDRIAELTKDPSLAPNSPPLSQPRNVSTASTPTTYSHHLDVSEQISLPRDAIEGEGDEGGVGEEAKMMVAAGSCEDNRPRPKRRRTTNTTTDELIQMSSISQQHIPSISDTSAHHVGDSVISISPVLRDKKRKRVQN